MAKLQDYKAKDLVNILLDNCPQAFKFHGEVAMQLFLNNQFDLPSIVDLCVERKHLTEVITALPNDIKLTYYNKNNHVLDTSQLVITEIVHITVMNNTSLLLNIFIYDVANGEWIFRLDNHVRLPQNNIYFHSLTWNVDYIKPEIVLMYDFLDNQNYHQSSSYKKVLDALSYYQFVILQTVVGEDKIKKCLNE